ncbi:MAG: SWIM zinc finger family protein [Holophagaceae bacterium]|nr:SWIM zinc finger family protein [Holophagaceae bacterium]
MWGYFDYVPVSTKRANAEKEIIKRRKKTPDIAPVVIEGKKIAKTWWGVAWIENIESYADFQYRLERGRTYVRNGFVIDLKIDRGVIKALVMGTKVYTVEVTISPLDAAKWVELSTRCGHRIDNLQALIEGKFPKGLDELFKGSELFPSPKEIVFSCSCPDWAYLCKHVAAVLYAIGARFDADPTLFFKLRGVNFEELLKRSIDEKMRSMLANAKKKSHRVIKDADINELFDL